MADEFQAGICAENWWMNPSQSNLIGSSVNCSPIINNMDLISWPADLDIRARASDDQSGSANSEGSIVFEDIRKSMDQDGSLLAMNSTLEIMDSNLSSSITANWNPTLLDHDNKSNGYNYQNNLLDSLNSSSNYQQDAGNLSHIKKDWSPEKFSTFNEISSMESYKGQTNQGFSVSSSSYGYTSSLMQTLFHTDSDQDSVFGNQPMEYAALSNICPEKLNEFTSSNSLLKPSPLVLPKQPLNHLNLPNNSAWNASNHSLFPSGQSQFFSPKFADKLNCPNLSVKSDNERNHDTSTAVKINNSTEPVFKRQRMQTPSPLPTFKVRKEKLGDRVTALQQLVSPFGKTDTASVLHEAIEYIKLLHDQVTVLITPYIKGGSPPHDHEQTRRDPKGRHQELRSRGLCLVPISSTFPVASETTADFWTPTFGGSFR